MIHSLFSSLIYVNAKGDHFDYNTDNYPLEETMFTHLYRFAFSLLLITSAQAALENTTCQKCHPVIFQEYQNSMHAKASIFKDPVHKAVWDKHPAKAKGNYKCAKCHTPSDHALLAGKHPLEKNPVQTNEPISCQACHTIESIETHAKANANIYSPKKKYFFSADTTKKGQKVIFKEETSFFGMIKTTTGSPYHDIDYGNEGFYDGKMCLGCHDHKQNAKGFAICDLQVKQGNSKETCISCHMPQVKGPLANQKQSAKHAFHGVTIHHKPVDLSRYILLSLEKNTEGFEISIKNEATHTLFPQPLRLAQLRVTIEHEGEEQSLSPVSFKRVIGTEGKPSVPWIATEVISDNTIKALETRKISYHTPLKKGDHVVVTFGYYITDPKTAQKLGITDPDSTHFIPLREERFTIE
jgi:hypothetical protein